MTNSLHEFSIIGYLLTPSDDLNDARPLDALKAGKAGEILADARRYGEMGT
jgi:hypothetical protein